MILQGRPKTLVKNLIRYYVDTTGKEYDDFIASIVRNKGVVAKDLLSYPDWLALKSYEELKRHDVGIADCIENKDTIRAAIMSDASRQDGEFYTPEVWCADGREYLKNMLGDKWGEAYIWDGSAGTGNLLKTIDYDRDKIFMSSLLQEDVELIKGVIPGVTAFQCDFLSGLDIESSGVESFMAKLPEKLRYVLENNLPIVVYMNPPYKVMAANKTDVGNYMSSLSLADMLSPEDVKLLPKSSSFKKCALDIFHQFMFRLILLKKHYKLTNMYLGIFGPVTLFHSNMLLPLYKMLQNEFVFNDGMCFTAGDFANTSESVGWVVGYTAWKSKQEGDVNKSILLTAKSADLDGNIVVKGEKLIQGVVENLHDWTKVDVQKLDNAYDTVELPLITSMFNKVGKDVTILKCALGQMMSSNFIIRAARRASITTLPIVDGQDITVENFWRCVGSYAARRCYHSAANAFNNCQYCNKPDETIEGYQQWLIDCLPVFLFDFNSQIASYRQLETNELLLGESVKIDACNKLFPIDASVARSVIDDINILEDLEKYSKENSIFLSILQPCVEKMSPEALELFSFCVETILSSLSGEARKQCGYENHTLAWDAGLIQLRTVPALWSTEKEQRMSYLLNRLKDKLIVGVYKYGYMMDSMLSDDANLDVENSVSDNIDDSAMEELNALGNLSVNKTNNSGGTF